MHFNLRRIQTACFRVKSECDRLTLRQRLTPVSFCKWLVRSQQCSTPIKDTRLEDSLKSDIVISQGLCSCIFEERGGGLTRSSIGIVSDYTEYFALNRTRKKIPAHKRIWNLDTPYIIETGCICVTTRDSLSTSVRLYKYGSPFLI
jgi:hypothetical protein